jgi:centrosomal protein CEP135
MALLQYKDLECCNIKLQEKFHNLDQESNESRKQILAYQHQIKDLKEQIHAREVDIETLEKQVIDLSTEIEILRSTNEKVQRELDATKDLCEKLDIQKEKQDAELMEYRMATKELVEKNEKLRDNIQALREGSAETHVSASYHPTM